MDGRFQQAEGNPDQIHKGGAWKPGMGLFVSQPPRGVRRLNPKWPESSVRKVVSRCETHSLGNRMGMLPSHLKAGAKGIRETLQLRGLGTWRLEAVVISLIREVRVGWLQWSQPGPNGWKWQGKGTWGSVGYQTGERRWHWNHFKSYWDVTLLWPSPSPSTFPQEEPGECQGGLGAQVREIARELFPPTCPLLVGLTWAGKNCHIGVWVITLNWAYQVLMGQVLHLFF